MSWAGYPMIPSGIVRVCQGSNTSWGSQSLGSAPQTFTVPGNTLVVWNGKRGTRKPLITTVQPSPRVMTMAKLISVLTMLNFIQINWNLPLQQIDPLLNSVLDFKDTPWRVPKLQWSLWLDLPLLDHVASQSETKRLKLSNPVNKFSL